MSKVLSLLTLILAISLQSCATMKLQSPTVDLVNIDMNNPSFSDATLIFNLLVKNPNSVDVKIDQVDYSVKLNNKQFTNGTLSQSVLLPAKSSAKVAVPAPIKFTDLSDSVAGLLQSGSTPYQISGSVKMGLLKIPFNEKGDLKLSDLKK